MTTLPSTRSPQFAIVFFVFLFFLALNSSPYQISDTANFYFEGLLTFNGYLPYQDFNDNKGPLFYYLLSVPAALTGWNMMGGIVLFRILDCAVFFSLCRLLKGLRLSTGSRIAAMAAFIFAYSAAFSLRDETIYSEVPELLLRTLGYTSYLVEGSIFRAGIFFGIATLFRQTAVVDLAAMGIAQLALLVFRQGTFIQVIRRLVLLGIGFALPVGLLAALACYQGWFDDFYRHAITWNMRLGGAVARDSFSKEFLYFLSAPFLPLIFLSLFRLLTSINWRSNRLQFTPEAYQATAYSLVAIFHLYEVIISPLFFIHHAIPALMILTVFAAQGVEKIARVWPGAGIAAMGKAFGAVIALIALWTGAVHFVQYQALEEQARVDRELAGWIKEHSTPEQKILVWGYAAQFYLNAERFPASRFHHNLGLTNQSRLFKPISPQSLEEFQHDLQVNQPQYIVLPAGELSYPDLIQYAPAIENEYLPLWMEFAQKRVFLLQRK